MNPSFPALHAVAFFARPIAIARFGTTDHTMHDHEESSHASDKSSQSTQSREDSPSSGKSDSKRRRRRRKSKPSKPTENKQASTQAGSKRSSSGRNAPRRSPSRPSHTRRSRKYASHFQVALDIVRTLQAKGHDAVFVGGWFRDRILGLKVKDVDVATSATPDEVCSLFKRTLQVGKTFGVVLVLQGPHKVEVASFRHDGPSLDGRHPSYISLGHLREDQFRRDFTVNAFAYDPIAGRLYDYVGAYRDASLGLIRSIGDPWVRYQEDYLRMLRCIRFATKLNFEVERDTWQAVKDFAPKIETISIERIREEVLKILGTAHPERGLDLLDRSGMLRVILPELLILKKTPDPTPADPNATAWDVVHRALSAIRPDKLNPALGVAVAIHSLGKPLVRQDTPEGPHYPRFGRASTNEAELLCKRLRMTKAMTHEVLSLLRHQNRLAGLVEAKAAQRRRFMANVVFQDHLEMARAIAKARGEDTEAIQRLRDEFDGYSGTMLPDPLLSGSELKRMGYEAGPRLGRILRKLQDLQMDGVVRTPKQAASLVRKRWPLKRKAS